MAMRGRGMPPRGVAFSANRGGASVRGGFGGGAAAATANSAFGANNQVNGAADDWGAGPASTANNGGAQPGFEGRFDSLSVQDDNKGFPPATGGFGRGGGSAAGPAQPVANNFGNAVNDEWGEGASENNNLGAAVKSSFQSTGASRGRGGGFSRGGSTAPAPPSDSWGSETSAPTNTGASFGSGRGGGASGFGGGAPTTRGFGNQSGDDWGTGDSTPANNGPSFGAGRGGRGGARGGGAGFGGAPATGGFGNNGDGGFGGNTGFDNGGGGFGGGGRGGGRGGARGGGAGGFGGAPTSGGFGSGGGFGGSTFGNNDFGGESGFGGGGFGSGGGGGFGGGGSGGGSGCRNCGQDGHFARECTEPKKPQGACRNCGEEGHWSKECPNPSAGQACYNCGQEGHMSRDCQQERQQRGGGGGGCYNCGGEGHMSRDCTEPKKPQGACRNCGEEGHWSKECPNPPAAQPCFNCGQEGHLSRECTEERKPRNTEGMSCFNCGGMGHLSRECPEERKPRDTSDMTCFTCNQVGHASRDCPDRPPQTGPEDDPNYVPVVRRVDEIFADDVTNAEDYRICADADEEIVVIGSGENTIQKIETWAEANFAPQLKQNIDRAKYIKPRPIQQHTIPVLLDGNDVKGHAETGSGKSAAFLLPIIDWITKRKQAGEVASQSGAPFALILEPTRELCTQIYEQGRKFADDTGVTVAKAYGKYNTRENINELRLGCDILCATTGRAKDFIGKGHIRFGNLRFFVLDEADRLLDDSFMEDVRYITRAEGFPEKNNRQTLLFSATFPDQVQVFAQEILRDDHVIVSRKDRKSVAAASRVEQRVLMVSRDTKKDELLQLLQNELEEAKAKTPPGQEPKIRRTLVFVRTKRDADMVALYLTSFGLSAMTINGDRPQKEREEALLQFRQDRVRIVVATDVMARGIDIQGLDHVINMDLADSYATYVHRIGRTGRVHKGVATSYFDPSDNFDLRLANELMEGLKASGQPVPDFLQQAASGAMPPNASGLSNDDEWGAATQDFGAPKGGFGGGRGGAPASTLPENDDW